MFIVVQTFRTSSNYTTGHSFEPLQTLAQCGFTPPNLFDYLSNCTVCGLTLLNLFDLLYRSNLREFGVVQSLFRISSNLYQLLVVLKLTLVLAQLLVPLLPELLVKVAVKVARKVLQKGPFHPFASLVNVPFLCEIKQEVCTFTLIFVEKHDTF